MQDETPMAPVQELFAIITEALADDYTLEELLLFMQKIYRRRPLVIKYRPMPADRSGECRALMDVDLIQIDEDLDLPTRHMVLLHEISHLLLDDVEIIPQTYEAFQRDPIHCPALNRDSTHEHVRENRAEALATLLYIRLYVSETAIPFTARSLHGKD